MCIKCDIGHKKTEKLIFCKDCGNTSKFFYLWVSRTSQEKLLGCKSKHSGFLWFRNLLQHFFGEKSCKFYKSNLKNGVSMVIIRKMIYHMQVKLLKLIFLEIRKNPNLDDFYMITIMNQILWKFQPNWLNSAKSWLQMNIGFKGWVADFQVKLTT